MRILTIVGVLAVAARAQETFLDEIQVFTTSKEVLNLDFSKELGCGGCLRSGHTYCADLTRLDDDFGSVQAVNSTCCANTDEACVKRYADNLMTLCATLDKSLQMKYQGATVLFKDPLVGAQVACGKVQNNTACCGKRSDIGRFKPSDLHGLGDDDLCEFFLRDTNTTFALTLDLENVPYGESCSMEIKGLCGYPNLVVNNSNIDMIVSYKKSKWGDEFFKLDKDVDFDDDEVSHVKY